MLFQRSGNEIHLGKEFRSPLLPPPSSRYKLCLIAGFSAMAFCSSLDRQRLMSDRHNEQSQSIIRSRHARTRI